MDSIRNEFIRETAQVKQFEDKVRGRDGLNMCRGTSIVHLLDNGWWRWSCEAGGKYAKGWRDRRGREKVMSRFRYLSFSLAVFSPCPYPRWIPASLINKKKTWMIIFFEWTIIKNIFPIMLFKIYKWSTLACIIRSEFRVRLRVCWAYFFLSINTLCSLVSIQHWVSSAFFGWTFTLSDHLIQAMFKHIFIHSVLCSVYI